MENNFSRRVSKNLRTSVCFVQLNDGWALEEFKRSRWVNEPRMLNSACSNYRSLPIIQLVAAWTAQNMIISNTIPPPAVWLLSTAQWLASLYKYSQIRLKRHRFMRHLAYSVRYSVVQTNYTKYSVHFMTLQPSSTVYMCRVCVHAFMRTFYSKECVYIPQCLWRWW